jgi:hypothetical protein
LFDLAYRRCTTARSPRTSPRTSPSHGARLTIVRHIDRIHERVDLLLQVRSETAEHSEAFLSPDYLRTLAMTWLEERGYDRPEAEHATERPVRHEGRRVASEPVSFAGRPVSFAGIDRVGCRSSDVPTLSPGHAHS